MGNTVGGGGDGVSGGGSDAVMGKRKKDIESGSFGEVECKARVPRDKTHVTPMVKGLAEKEKKKGTSQTTTEAATKEERKFKLTSGHGESLVEGRGGSIRLGVDSRRESGIGICEREGKKRNATRREYSSFQMDCFFERRMNVPQVVNEFSL